MTSYNETWAPTWEVEKTIQGARWCLVENTDRSFKTGRAIVDAVFYDGNRREIERRSGMRLTSKAGKEYVVCKRERDCDKSRHRGTGYTASDVFDEL